MCRPDTVLAYLLLAYCHFREQCWEYFSEMLLHNNSLHHVDLGTNILKDEGLKTLCKALKHPDRRLDSLCLVKCSITAAGCEDLASVLISNQNLKNLEIGCSKIGDVGVKLLCGALMHPDCHVEVLGISLRPVNLTLNTLDHGGVVVLCEALRHPECALRVLGLKKADFGEETQALLMAEEERNPKSTIIDHL
ncbi:NACHT, LRR and PYD domains-containing protein 4 [Plecturocebus cupreus]